jgi:hypothetical protein
MARKMLGADCRCCQPSGARAPHPPVQIPQPEILFAVQPRAALPTPDPARVPSLPEPAAVPTVI